MDRVNLSKGYLKQLERAPGKIRNSVVERLEIFKKDRFHPLLNNHSLTGNYKGFRSINITGDWRAIYSETKDEKGNITVIFELLGTHSQLYR